MAKKLLIFMARAVDCKMYGGRSSSTATSRQEIK